MDRDPRVSPWTGTAHGVLQAVNTYDHYEGIVRGADRAERNSLKTLTDGYRDLDLDRTTLHTLNRVLQHASWQATGPPAVLRGGRRAIGSSCRSEGTSTSREARLGALKKGGRELRGAAPPLASDAVTVGVLLSLALGDAAASWLLLDRRRQDRNGSTVIVVGIVLALCAVSLVVIAVHVETRSAPARGPRPTVSTL